MTTLLLILCLQPPAQETKPADRQQQIRKTMEASAEKQKAAARKQMRQVRGLPETAEEPAPEKSWFTNPWPMDPIEPLGPPLPADVRADCGALPADQINPLIEAAARKEGVGVDLVRAVMEQESGYRACAVSSKGAQGLMQLMPATAQELGVKDSFDPAENIGGGVRLLKQLMTKYKGNLDLVLSAYNAGEARVDKDGAVPAIAETQQYVESIKKKLSASGAGSSAKPEAKQ